MDEGGRLYAVRGVGVVGAAPPTDLRPPMDVRLGVGSPIEGLARLRGVALLAVDEENGVDGFSGLAARRAGVEMPRAACRVASWAAVMVRYLLAREPWVILASAARAASADDLALAFGLGVVEGGRGRTDEELSAGVNGRWKTSSTLLAGTKRPQSGSQVKYFSLCAEEGQGWPEQRACARTLGRCRRSCPCRGMFP
jgi:hypothetical protein